MEAAASLQHLGDSFSCGWLKRGVQAPSLERLVGAAAAAADLGHSFGSSRSFIDMDPAELFSMRWTTTTSAPAPKPPESDFDFGLPGGSGGGGSDPPSPVLVSASRIIRDGRLLPSEPVVCRSGLQEPPAGDRVADLPLGTPSWSSLPSSPLFQSAQSTPASLNSCPSGRLGAAAAAAGRRRRSRAPSWKILLQYLRFLMPLYRKVRAMRRFSAPGPRVAPASPARASSTSSIDWCHGNADTAVRDAILYCKKSSSGQDA